MPESARGEQAVRQHAPASSDFSELLKRLRTRAGISQQTLAARAHISVQAVSALERGYRKAPYRDTLDRLADALSLGSEDRAAFEAAALRARGAVVTPTHNLPHQLTSFLGRDDVVDEIAGYVDAFPLVSIVGTGGAGKTRTAIEVSTRLVDAFSGGAWFVELAPLADARLIAAAIGTALGVQESSQRAALESVVAFLNTRRLLLVLDNCEHVIDEVRTVAAEILRACPGVRVLATSREALNVAGERVYRIPPLPVPRRDGAVAARDALAFGAVALFAERAAAAGGRFAVTEENVADVVDVCRRLDGLPLAIELAAARTTMLSPRQLAARLNQVFSVLTGGRLSTLPRHRTMRALIDWSYGLLAAQAQLVFDRLAVFAGGFTFESALEVCSRGAVARDDVFDILASLVDKSLVMVDFGAGDARYHLLEATRQYALERLVERGERESVAALHAPVFVAIAERLDREWYAAPEREWFFEAEAELDNFRAALEWSLGGRNDVALGQRLAAALARVAYSLSAAEGRRWVRLALETADAATPPALVAQLHVADAALSAALGEHKVSLEAAQRALLLRDALDPLLAARAKQAAGAALDALGLAGDGERLLREALRAAEALGNERLRATILGKLGTACTRSGDDAAARAYYAQALTIYQSRNLERQAASIAGHLAEIEFSTGDPEAALLRAEEALRGHSAANNKRSVANDVCNMAAYLVALDCYDEAADRAAEAIAIGRDLHAILLTTLAVQHVATICALRPDSSPVRARRNRDRAARLMGYVDARLAALETSREYTEQREYERMLAALTATCGERTLADLCAQGALWTDARAVDEALTALEAE